MIREDDQHSKSAGEQEAMQENSHGGENEIED